MDIKERWGQLREENQLIAQVDQFYRRNQRYAPLLSFVAGFAWDSLTLTRIDRLIDNLILLAYLCALMTCLLLSNLSEAGKLKNPRLMKYDQLYSLGIQFFLGGLFSAYVIYYFQSASFSKNLVFVGLLVSMMFAVEALKHHLGDHRLQLILFYLVSHSFLAFFFPILFRKMGHEVFVLAGAVSYVLLVVLLGVFYQQGVMTSPRRLYGTLTGALLLFALLDVLYRTNLIPPVPLSLKHGGVYHSVEKSFDQYRLGYEKAPWWVFWREADRPFHFVLQGDQLVGFTAIFAPDGLRERIRQDWYWFDPEAQEWVLKDQQEFEITGGRARGWRNFYLKKQIFSGPWRIEVLNSEERLIGEVEFEVQVVEKKTYRLGYQLR
ncbi:MAG: DUF2914 domain-containing protein [bacterium]|nr:DUF2914 domain-containing protein [bacterium]